MRRIKPGSPVLSRREHEVLVLLSEGLTDKEIAARLHISTHTASKHVASVLGKLGVHNRAHAVAKYGQSAKHATPS